MSITRNSWLHFFYAKEVTLDELCEIERRTLGAMEWGHEVKTALANRISYIIITTEST